MTDEQSAKAGEPTCADHADGGSPATPRQRRMSAKRKQEAVLRVLRGEDLELVSRELGITAADLSGWRDSFLEAGAASLKSRAEDDRDKTIKALHAKLGEITMANELLEAKIDKLEAGAPFRLRRLKR